MFDKCEITDIKGFGIGHATNFSAATGVTTIVAEKAAKCSCDIRGGGPATRETDLLSPEKMIQGVNAIVLSGGSAFGLESASAAARVLSEHKMGFDSVGNIIPIVPSACIFDLGIGNSIDSYLELGKIATENAIANINSSTPPASGNVGVGAGATVGMKGLPKKPMKSGVGFATFSFGKVKVGACVVVNALGNVYTENGEFLAGFDDEKTLKRIYQAFNLKSKVTKRENTTLACIITNADVSKSQCKKVSQVAHDGFARAIRPVHTQMDGDATFVMASGKVKADVDVVSMMAAQACEEAIRNAVKSAKSTLGFNGLFDGEIEEEDKKA